MEYTEAEVKLAYSLEMNDVVAQFDEWFRNDDRPEARVFFFDFTLKVFGVSETQFERSMDIRKQATALEMVYVQQ